MKLRLIITVFLFAFPFSALSAPKYQNNSARLLYVFATGPDLYDPAGKSRREKWNKESDSAYAKRIVDQLIERIKFDHPSAETLHLKSFTYRNLRAIYQLAVHENVDRVILSIVAHGGIDHGNFYIWTDAGKLFEDELLDIIRDTPTDVAFFTCNSGAIHVEDFPGGVFGASLRHTGMDAVHFYGWAKFLQLNSLITFPTSAVQIHQSWLRYRIHDRIRSKRPSPNETDASRNLAEEYKEKCWGGPYPFFFESPEDHVLPAAAQSAKQ